MRLAAWLTPVVCLVGCATAEQERVRAYNEDGLDQFRRARYVEAAQSFEAALALTPEDAALQFNLAQCYDHLGQLDRAEKVYLTCLQRDGKLTRCRYALIGVMVRKGQWNEAVQLAQDWMAEAPREPGPYAADGFLWHQAGDLPRAQARLQQALDLDPTYEPALDELALIYESLQQPERALVLYQQSLDKNPRQPGLKQRVDQLVKQGVGVPRPQ